MKLSKGVTKMAAGNGLIVYIGWEDGKVLGRTADVNLRRLNLYVQQGKVVCSYLG